MAHEEFKDLTRRTASDKILHDKAFSFAKSKIQWIATWTCLDGL